MPKTIDPQHAADLHDEQEPDATAGPGTFVAVHPVRKTRWEEVLWLVVRETATGDLYGLEYREGLTEEQETTYPWDEHDDAPLPLVALTAHEVTTVDYREVAA